MQWNVMKYISSIKPENSFCDWLGQGAFYRDDFGNPAAKCGLQKWNLGTFQFIGLWFYKCTTKSTSWREYPPDKPF